MCIVSRFVIFCALMLQLDTVFSFAFHKQECSRDVDCAAGSFCDTSTCEVCVPCQSVFNRQSTFRSDGCARLEEDCGECLLGFQSEDLTGQRRSFKCSLVLAENFETSLPNTWNNFIIWLLIAVIVCSVVFTVICFIKENKDANNTSRPENEKLTASKADNLPPPYPDQVITSEETFILTTVQTDSLNDAIPMMNPLVNIRDFNLPFDNDDRNSTMGSTETIPSQWEPESSYQLINSTEHHNGGRLVRSFSLDIPIVRTSAPLSSRSYSLLPNLTGVYRDYHVHLSHYRLTNESGCSDLEPLPPLSFSYMPEISSPIQAASLTRSISVPDRSSHSNDSGYFENFQSAQSSSSIRSNRRPAEQLLSPELSFSVFIKRRREQ